MPSSRREIILILLVLGLAVFSRSVSLWVFSENLSDDRDAYLAIAENISEGHGYRAASTADPTAFRPPMYAMLLAGIFKLGGCSIAVGILQLLLGTGTVFLTWKLGRQLGLEKYATYAALLVAVDPLSIQYTTFPMTETLFTFLLMILFSFLLRPGSRSISYLSLMGALFGLCALCRPTIWGFGILVSAVWVLKRIQSRSRDDFRSAGVVIFSTALIVSPWLIRNIVVLKKPILTTTHGGYTLLLGNNPVFYAEVVRQPWGTTWESAPAERSQQAWFADVYDRMLRELGNNSNEWTRDRWMYRRALLSISDDPLAFLQACCLRFGRFWNIVPLRSARNSLSDYVFWAIGVFYSITLTGMLVGIVRLDRKSWKKWSLLGLLLLSFSMIHLFYWSNMRMRTPLIPFISLWVVRGICLKDRNSAELSKTVE